MERKDTPLFFVFSFLFCVVSLQIIVMNSSDGVVSNGGKKVLDKAADFANYFCTYAFLYHQKEMLSDRVRMEAYYSSIFKNARQFKDKVVLDVGTGSGILAIWAAQAGASKVYAVEATNMAQHARDLIRGNAVDHIVEVLQGSMEDLVLPEKVDIIISEWMGYFLVRESMFDSVIVARDRWLKPDGKMYPSHARMWLAPIRTGLGDHKRQEFENSMTDWSNFVEDTRQYFGVDMQVLNPAYKEEQQKYFLQTSLWNNLYPNQIVGRPVVVKEIDCKYAKIEDIEDIRSEFVMPLMHGAGAVSGFAGWFDVHFRGSREDPSDTVVELTTAPSVDASTHWGQQVFLLQPTIRYNDDDVLQGSLQITRSEKNHRLMDVKFVHYLSRRGKACTPSVVSAYSIE